MFKVLIGHIFFHKLWEICGDEKLKGREDEVVGCIGERKVNGDVEHRGRHHKVALDFLNR